MMVTVRMMLELMVMMTMKMKRLKTQNKRMQRGRSSKRWHGSITLHFLNVDRKWKDWKLHFNALQMVRSDWNLERREKKRENEGMKRENANELNGNRRNRK